jgi:two-component system, cell cycle sensor histidine kinase and response regulator CckA
MSDESFAELDRQLNEARRQVDHFRRVAEECGDRRLREAKEMSGLIDRLRRAEKAVERSRDELEARVRERTAELEQVNERLRAEGQERGHIENELRASEDSWRTFCENTIMGIYRTTPDGRILMANPALLRMLGFDSFDQLARRNLETEGYEPGYDRRQFKEALERDGQIVALEARWIRRDGTPLWIRESARSVRDGRGVVTCYEGTVEDITERKRAEEALQASEAKYRRLHETMRDAFASVDMAGRIGETNRAYREMVGYSEEELSRLTYRDLTPEKWHAFEEEIIRDQVLKRGYSDVYEKEYRRKDGTVFPVELRTFRLGDAAGRPASMWAIVRDVTERKRAEEGRLELERRLQQIRRLESLGVLAGGIAHDFNNLLAAILGNADLALEELPLTAPARENLREIKDCSKRAADLCRQMLAYSGKGRFFIETLRLRELLEEMVPSLRASVSPKAVLSLRLEDDLPPVRADATQLRQIILNLVLNASEALGDHPGRINLSAGTLECPAGQVYEACPGDSLPSGRYVWLEVADTGCGMDAETRRRAFEPFFTTKFMGRGLGLSAVQGIVRGHEGSLQLRSEPGKGTTFRVLLPAPLEVPVEGDAVGGAPRPGKSRGTVLLVEDEAPVRNVGRKLLERLGFQVLIAEDGREALRVYQERSQDIQLVLLDLTMPNLSGEATFRELHRLNPRLPVVIASGFSEADIRSRFSGQAVAGVVPKPYTKEQLVQRLHAVLGPAAPR